MKRKFFTLFVLLAILLAGLPVPTARAVGTTVYVDADSTCFAFCGGSWATAYPELTTAIAAASSEDTIWAAEGVYYPTSTSDRAISFALKNGVKIYGGFAGTESRLIERDIAANPTILSGDIDKNDVNIDGNFIAETTADLVGNNSYHVLTALNGTDNTAFLDGFIITAGKADSATNPEDDAGGMLIYYGSPTLTNLVFQGNYAAQEGGGLKNAHGSPILNRITFNENSSADVGGGFYDSGGAATLTDVTFSNNHANNYGGGMQTYFSSSILTNVIFNSNKTFTYDGGGLAISGGSPHLTTVTFNGNIADYHGGGMYILLSSPVLDNITFIDNYAPHGGGLYNNNSSPTISNSLFNGNDAGIGGGILNHQSNAVFTNVTISGNTAQDGAGVYNLFSQPTLQYVTISDNIASLSGGGILNNTDSLPILHGVLIANNTNGDCVNEAGVSLDAASSNNLIEDSVNACDLTNGTNGNVVGLDPQLGLLAENGGTTKTHALLVGSPAIDAVANDPACPATDQRGIARPQGAKCDIGAYEFEQSSLTLRSQAANDGWILESGENTSTGGTKDNQATVFRLGDGEADKQYRAIVSFNTASLPDDAIITYVVVKIKEQGISGTNPFTILGGLKVDMQKPFFGSTLGLTITDFEAAAGKTGVATFGATATNNWYSAILNVGGMAFVNKTGVTQFRLRFATADDDDNAADYMKFFSGNHSVAANRPTLIIKYYVP